MTLLGLRSSENAVYIIPMLSGKYQNIDVHVKTLSVTSENFSDLPWPKCESIVQHLWHLVEQEIGRMNVQLEHLQKFCGTLQSC